MTRAPIEICLGTVPIRLDASVTDTGKHRIITSYDGKPLGLTEAGLEFLKLCDGRRNLREIGQILRRRFEAGEEREDHEAVIEFCHYLQEKKLIQVRKEV